MPFQLTVVQRDVNRRHWHKSLFSRHEIISSLPFYFLLLFFCSFQYSILKILCASTSYKSLYLCILILFCIISVFYTALLEISSFYFLSFFVLYFFYFQDVKSFRFWLFSFLSIPSLKIVASHFPHRVDLFSSQFCAITTMIARNKSYLVLDQKSCRIPSVPCYKTLLGGNIKNLNFHLNGNNKKLPF